MANLDITRHRAAPEFHYTGTRMQQGRALLDSDWNEDALLVSEDRRLTFVDLIGAHGSSNDGFNVTNLRVEYKAAGATIDFDLQPGSMFVGGMRLALESTESLWQQADWLRYELEEHPPAPPSVEQLLPNPLPPNTEAHVLSATPRYRYDLVFVLAWEQPVTAVEDAELRERALGGPDSAAAIRRMRRVTVKHDVGTDDPLVAIEAMVAGGYVTFDAQTSEAVSNARLTVTPLAPGGDVPCNSDLPDGYVGHEDEAIRVELRSNNTITWGFGNAAPLYRVRVGADGKRITFLNKPHDAKHQPKANQIVEIIPWSARLPNGEKVAEQQGELFRVLESYEPATGELVLDGAVSSESRQWLLAHGADRTSTHAYTEGFFYLRLWDRGADVSSLPEIKLDATPVELGKTGLQVSLAGLGLPGDYWVIAARRSTPDVVVPWQLLTSEAPHGPRRFVAPLAMLRWEAPVEVLTLEEYALLGNNEERWALPIDGSHGYAVWGPVRGVVIDVRRRLQRLCAGGGCCTITVGNGTTSFGLVDSLADALALLPSTGGRICLLPGEHAAAVTLTGRQNVEIYGYGEHCKLINAAEVEPGEEFDHAEPPLVTLEDCTNIKLRDFSIQADGAIGVKIRGTSSTSQCEGVLIERVSFTQNGTYDDDPSPVFALPQPAVLALGGDDITVRNCRVEVEDVLSYSGALVLGGTRLRILDNWVQGGVYESSSVAACMGGIHVLSQSSDVEVVGNVVHGGWGFGIALGHVLAWDSDPGSVMTISVSNIWTAAERGLGEPVTALFEYEPVVDAPVGSLEVDTDWTSAGALVDVRIERNHVTGMGLTGISTGMMRLRRGLEAAFIAIARLSVCNNVVIGNRRISSFPVSNVFAPRADGCCEVAVGGIVIAAAVDATIAENQVVDNGADDDWPNCGLGFIAAQNLVIRDNRVIDNGVAATSTVPAGLRGGIAIMEVTALRGATYFDTLHESVILETQPTFSVGASKLALHVHKNEVAQRSGRALWVQRGFDDILVTENSFSGKGELVELPEVSDFELGYQKGTSPTRSWPAAGACVEIFGLSQTPDIDWGALSTPGLLLVQPGAGPTVGGIVEFSGNRGELDWTNNGGYASAYMISSSDSVVLADNVLAANLHGGSGAFDDDFLNDLMDTPSGQSFVYANCYVGSVGPALVRGNRFEEDERGALFSAVVGPAPAVDHGASALRNGVVLTSCVGTHCMFAVPPPNGDQVVVKNVPIIQKPSGGCSYVATITGPPTVVVLTY